MHAYVHTSTRTQEKGTRARGQEGTEIDLAGYHGRVRHVAE